MKILPEIGILLDPKSPEAKTAIGFKFADKNIGKRSKFGGSPDWIQGNDTPVCACGECMTFYGQLDSIGDEIVLGDCGMLYSFVCFSCFKSSIVMQCY